MQYHWNLLTMAKEVVTMMVMVQELSKAAVDVVTLWFSIKIRATAVVKSMMVAVACSFKWLRHI